MTEQEFNQVKFKFLSHLNMEDEHMTTYMSEDNRLGYCNCVRFKNGQPHGKGRRHYFIDGKWYHSKKKFLEALSEFNPKIVPIRKGL